ncbi:MAG TPA: lipid A export permease/ATP-binding protein MsbA [Chromobacteriaceae bacterium]|nr:lipid A export permease/ATP-binding protein MsbA [Chromobacteriaceae bacterium]
MPSPGFQKNWMLYKRLLTYLRRYWKVFFASLVSLSIAASTEAAFVSLMKPLVDHGFVGKDLHAIYWIPPAIVGLFVLRGVTSFINEYSTSWLTGHLVQTLRQEMFVRLLRLPVPYYDDNMSGRLMSRITYDADQVTVAGFNIITVSVKDGITVLSLLGYLLYLDWQLTLICFTVFPAVALCIRIVSKRLRKLSHQSQLQIAQVTQILNDSITCQKLVKIYGGESYEVGRFDKASADLRRNAVKQVSASSISTSLTQLFIAIALAFVLYFAAMRAQQNVLSAGAFMAFLSAMTMLFAPIKRIANISQSLQKGLAAAESVFAFLDETTENDHGTRQLASPKGQITFQQLSFRYPHAEKWALEDINLVIQPGETVALVGASGSGKTTLVSLLPRFYDPTQGQILLDGIPVEEIRLASLREHIALVSQEVVLFNDTVAANIAYGRMGNVSRDELMAAAQAANALEFIEAMPDGFDTVIGEHGVKLSGGQRQRLAIARALLKNAPILILDEATSALDTVSEHLVQEALEKLMQNRTTIVIAHRLSTIENADRIVVMNHGRIAEIGTHQTLLAAKGLYANLHKIHFQGS